MLALGFILVTLKLTGLIACSWLVALAPFLLELFFYVVAVNMASAQRR